MGLDACVLTCQHCWHTSGDAKAYALFNHLPEWPQVGGGKLVSEDDYEVSNKVKG